MKYQVEVFAVDTIRKKAIVTVDAPEEAQAERKALSEALEEKDNIEWLKLDYNNFDHFMEAGSIVKQDKEET